MDSTENNMINFYWCLPWYQTAISPCNGIWHDNEKIQASRRMMVATTRLTHSPDSNNARCQRLSIRNVRWSRHQPDRFIGPFSQVKWRTLFHLLSIMSWSLMPRVARNEWSRHEVIVHILWAAQCRELLAKSQPEGIFRPPRNWIQIIFIKPSYEFFRFESELVVEQLFKD